MVYGVMTIVLPYQRERSIGNKLSTVGGFGYSFRYCGPTWIPDSAERNWIRVFDRIYDIHVVHQSSPSPAWLLPELKSEVEILDLLSDFGTLKNLESLDLHDTQVTDAGLEKLNRLTNLTTLNLMDTNTTPAGRGLLRKALPNCQIAPYP